MKQFHRTFAIKIFTFFCFLFLISCSNHENSFKNWAEDNERVRVLSTTAMIGDVVKEIGGKHIHNLVLIQGELDPHSYELVKGDDEKLQRADIIFYNGLGLEHGASLAYQLKESSHALSLGAAIQEEGPEKILEVDQTFDPHIWMDVLLWKEATYPIEKALVERVPAAAKEIRENANKVRAKMERLDGMIQTIVRGIPDEKRYLITSHDAFNYFAKAYLANSGENWENRFRAPEGLAPEGQLSALDIQRIIDFVKENQIGVIFAESNVSQDSIRKIIASSKKMGMDVRIASDVLYGDAMGPFIEEKGATYFDMMLHNAKVLKEHLQ